MHSSNGCRYVTDFLSPSGLYRNSNNQHQQTAKLLANKRETSNKCFFFLSSEIFFFFLSNSSKQKEGKRVLTALSQLSCHLSPWHKSERKDFYNGWHRCCKLVSPCCLSSHWAYKHPLPTETLTGALRCVCTLFTTEPDPMRGARSYFIVPLKKSIRHDKSKTYTFTASSLQPVWSETLLRPVSAVALQWGEFHSTRGHLTLPCGETEKDDGGYLRLAVQGKRA